MTTTPKAPKLTTCERRALAYCESLLRNDGGTVSVSWGASGTYGKQASIYDDEGMLCYRTGGCGFDKLSSCLANVLRFLLPIGTDGHKAIWRKCGAGCSSVRDALAAHGWKLEATASGKSYDVFTLTKI